MSVPARVRCVQLVKPTLLLFFFLPFGGGANVEKDLCSRLLPVGIPCPHLFLQLPRSLIQNFPVLSPLYIHTFSFTKVPICRVKVPVRAPALAAAGPAKRVTIFTGITTIMVPDHCVRARANSRPMDA